MVAISKGLLRVGEPYPNFLTGRVFVFIVLGVLYFIGASRLHQVRLNCSMRRDSHRVGTC